MERLQAAIEKARSKRRTRAPLVVPGSREPRAVMPEVAAAWAALPEFTLDQPRAQKRRLVSFLGGRDAGPYDMLRTKVLHMMRTNGWKRLALTSPNSGCGKTTTSSNLAISLGRQTELRTMVFDLDMRRPSLGKVLSLNGQSSFSDVLEGRTDFASQGVRLGANVAFGCNYRPASNPAELLQSPHSIETIAAIEATYQPDLMIFDMPPMLASDDNVAFLKNVDCAILVAAAESTTIEQIDMCERELSELTNVVGVVLNKCRFNDMTYSYEYGYGA